jgi:hypothetical protein
LILWGGCDLVLGSSLPCARGGGHTGRTYPARPMPQGEEAGNAPGFPRLPRHGSRTSGREHLPLAFVARPRAASHPSAAAPGARPICAPLPRGGPGALAPARDGSHGPARPICRGQCPGGRARRPGMSSPPRAAGANLPPPSPPHRCLKPPALRALSTCSPQNLQLSLPFCLECPLPSCLPGGVCVSVCFAL